MHSVKEMQDFEERVKICVDSYQQALRPFVLAGKSDEASHAVSLIICASIISRTKGDKNQNRSADQEATVAFGCLSVYLEMLKRGIGAIKYEPLGMIDERRT